MIKKIVVKGLNGHFDFTIPFHQDLNLLTGKNGVGKTTVLKLIYYIISGKEGKLSGDMVDQSTFFTDLKNTTFQDNADRAIHQFIN